MQAKIKLPDTTAGMWPSLWFMPPTSGSSNELDGFEGGFENPGLGPQNQLIHYDYFSPAGEVQHMANVGVDMSAGYHTYGVEYIPNVVDQVLLRRGLGGHDERRAHPRRVLRDHDQPDGLAGQSLGIAHGPDPRQLPREHHASR